jgi:hypothetical protein
MGGIVLCQDAASKFRIKVVNEACWRFQRAMFLFRFVHICSVLFPWLPFKFKKPLRCFWRRPKEACIPLINARSSRTTSLRSKILSVSSQCQVEDGTGRYCRRWWEIVSPCQHGHGWPTGYRVRKREFSTPFSWDERVGRLASWFFLVFYVFHASQFIQVPLKIWVYFVQKQVLFASTWKPIADPLLCMWQQHWPLSQTSAMITGLGAFQASWPCTICTAWTGTQGEVSKLVDMVDVIQSLVTSLWHQTSLMKNGDFPRFKELSASWHCVLNATMTEHVCGHALGGWTKDIVCTGLPTLCLVEIFEIFCWLAPDTSARNFNTLEFNEPDKATTITTRKPEGVEWKPPRWS